LGLVMTRPDLNVSCLECILRTKSVFCGLNLEQLGEVDAEKEMSLYRKGQIVFQEGTHPRGLFVVKSGKVKVYKLGSSAREQIVRLAKPGDIVGYRSLIGGEAYYATAQTLEDTILCYISRDVLYKLIDANPQLALNLMKLLSHDLATAEKKMVELVQKPVRERVAEALLVLKEIYGLEEDNRTLNIRLTREDIASFVGTTTETAIRVLSEFKEEKLVALEKKKIILLDIPRMTRESHIND
jgi:CRP/FNR family transcriptional regulator, polysaccharide utilization system transcription regulator